MLIYNEKMSVSPLTTHIPIKICCRKYHKKKINYKYSKYKKILLKNIKKTSNLQFWV